MQMGLSSLGIYLQLFESDSTLWFDADNQLCACTQIKADAQSWRTQIHLDHYTDDLFITILRYAEAQLGIHAAVHTVAYGRDKQRIDLLTNNGYMQGDALDVYMQRSLADTIPEAKSITRFYHPRVHW